VSRHGDRRGTARRRPPVALTISAIAGTLYLLLTGLVADHVVDALDQTARQRSRPGNVWGPLQLRADHIVEGLKPAHVVPLLLVVVLACAVVQRSWRPVVVGAVSVLSTGALVVATKILVARPDPGGDIATIGGAYPSGHTAVLMAVAGAGLLAIISRPAWWSWVSPVLGDAMMAFCLVVQTTHWLSDVVGGMLAAFTVLGLSAWVSSQWDVRRLGWQRRRQSPSRQNPAASSGRR
jgi:membrane-associated phospholipid phosphatase